ncbi:MAG: hypothetical protein QNJ46_29320 [Leptolyngbyaceae cyanobacterium MO_188.B28]|nr:hypothetical protein [Leptolyngbyaceae cyanobacterium MO_188.B28]
MTKRNEKLCLPTEDAMASIRRTAIYVTNRLREPYQIACLVNLLIELTGESLPDKPDEPYEQFLIDCLRVLFNRTPANDQERLEFTEAIRGMAPPSRSNGWMRVILAALNNRKEKKGPIAAKPT